MKIVDYIIIAALLGCCYLAYAGFRIEAVLLGSLVLILASWRFWDSSREKHMMRTGSPGYNTPDHPDTALGSSRKTNDTDYGSADED